MLDQSKLSLSHNELYTKPRKSNTSVLSAVPDLEVKDPAAVENNKLSTRGNESDYDLTPEEKKELKLARMLDVPKSEQQHWQVDGEFSRVNGFEPSFHPRQVSMVIWFFLNEAMSLYLIVEGIRRVHGFKLPKDTVYVQDTGKMVTQYVLISLQVILFFTTFYYGYRGMSSDPTDPAIYY